MTIRGLHEYNKDKQVQSTMEQHNLCGTNMIMMTSCMQEISYKLVKGESDYRNLRIGKERYKIKIKVK